MKFSLQKRLSNNWSANANYTYSKCINQGEPATDIGNIYPVPLIDPITNPHPDATPKKGRATPIAGTCFNLSSVLISPGLAAGSSTRSRRTGRSA